MSVVEDLSEEEKYLLAILLDTSGIDQAEFLWKDETSKDAIFRCYDFQYSWYRTHDKFQIDQCARSVGKSLGIQMRAFAFPFHSPGEEMLLTAPEMIHLDPVTKRVADRIVDSRVSREMLKKRGASNGITHRPFEAKFVNGARIVGRIPQKDGRGVKGMHPKQLEMDEAQDYPEPGWVELGETLKYGNEDAIWRAHGVSRGVRDRFYKQTQEGSGWTVHRITAMHRGDWGLAERESKAELYGSRDHPDYRRNILGLHGDAQSALFVLTRLMQCVDSVQSSDYNENEYHHVRITEEKLNDSGLPITALLQLPGRHQAYGVTWGGMDVGLCVDEETEIFTRRGWLTHEEVVEGDQCLSINPETGCSEWKPIEWIYRDRRPEGWGMIEMQGQSFSALTTPHHRWLVRHESGKLRWVTTQTMNSKDAVPLTAPRGDAPNQAVHSDAFVEMVGWYMTEGTRSRYIASWCQSERKAGNVERIISAMTSELGEPGEISKGALWSDTVRELASTTPDGVTHDSVMRYFRVSAVTRDRLDVVAPKSAEGRPTPTMDFLQELTRDQLMLLLDVVFLADGWEQEGRRSLETSYRGILDVIEAACALAGLATSTLSRPERGSWRVLIKGSADFRPVKAAQMSVSTTVREVHYDGTIWCPSVGDNTNWLARRRGSVYFTGNTNHPSEILVFGEVTRTKSSKYPNPEATLKLLTRIHLERISAPDQRKVMEAVWDHYRCRGFAMDRTGLGFPIYQEIMSDGAAGFQNSIRAYNFSEKIIAGYERDEQDEEVWWEESEPEPIYALVLEYASDMLRLLVDTQRLMLPWDVELLREFQGQTYQISRSSTNPYGRKVFSQGRYHALDAARMAATAFFQEQLGNFDIREKEAVLDSFLIA